MKAGATGNNPLINEIMKKFLMLFSLVVLLSSCYDDYVQDFDKSFVYLPYQTNVRTFVVGEGMKVEVGVVLGGVLDNRKQRVVNYSIDNSIITPQVYESMTNDPRDYVKNNVWTSLSGLSAGDYTLSDSKVMVIKKGAHNGTIVIRPDSAKFLADVENLKAKHALGFVITSCTDVDTINMAKNTAVIAFRYENMLFGNWFRSGVATANGQTSAYRAKINQSNDDLGILTTVAPLKLYYNHYGVPTNKGGMYLTLNKDHSITISNDAEALPQIIQDGECKYNSAKKLQDRKIFLSYKYIDNGVTVQCKDTLAFRDRVRDGVLEYQDENPNNYK